MAVQGKTKNQLNCLKINTNSSLNFFYFRITKIFLFIISEVLDTAPTLLLGTTGAIWQVNAKTLEAVNYTSLLRESVVSFICNTNLSLLYVALNSTFYMLH